MMVSEIYEKNLRQKPFKKVLKKAKPSFFPGEE